MASGRSSRTISGRISGSGLASARISGLSAELAAAIPRFSTRGRGEAEEHIGARAARPPGGARRCPGRSGPCSAPCRCGRRWTTPLMSVRVTFSTCSPIATSRSTQARAAAPAPEVTSLTSSRCLPCSSSPLRTAAATVMAVPCWSSWKTGMFIRARSSASMAKHSGALMSSRLMAPKVGSSAATTSQKRSGSAASTSMSNTSMPANFLNRTALPSITGLPASAPILPRPSTAVPLEMTPTRLPRAV